MNQKIYALGLALVKRPRLTLSGELPDDVRARAEAILTAERARGAALAVFDERGVRCVFGGEARFQKGTRVTRDTRFRVASASKFVTAYGAVSLAARGEIDLDTDISIYLGYPVRNPNYQEDKITLRQLLSHTSSIIDGPDYLSALSMGGDAQALLQTAFAPYRPGAGFTYSNFGAGLIGCVLEGALHRPFDEIMHDTVFAPNGVEASYYPQRVKETLADAWRLFPPAKGPNFDAAARQKRPLQDESCNTRRDYLLAHGSLCISAPDLARLTRAIVLDKPVFDKMRAPVMPFGARDRTLTEGLGTFIYREKPADAPLYGHQGLAYGAVHGVFTDEKGRGFVVLTSAVSEQRQGVLTRMNRALCAMFFQEGVWRGL